MLHALAEVVKNIKIVAEKTLNTKKMSSLTYSFLLPDIDKTLIVCYITFKQKELNMKQNKNEMVRTIFIGDSVKQMSDLLVHLARNQFNISLKKAGDVSKKYNIQSKTYYAITAPVSQHSEVFDSGVEFCIKNNYNDIICCYPNLDFDNIQNIRDRKYGFTM